MDKQEISLLKSKFDELAHVDESGVEYWFCTRDNDFIRL